MNLPTSMRKAESEKAYQEAKKLGFTKPLSEEKRLLHWKHWYLIANRFPYDMVFSEHDMLLPVSGVSTRAQLNLVELVELQRIIEELSNQYDMVFENFTHRRSVLSIYHLHLARYYRTREEQES